MDETTSNNSAITYESQIPLVFLLDPSPVIPLIIKFVKEQLGPLQMSQLKILLTLHKISKASVDYIFKRSGEEQNPIYMTLQALGQRWWRPERLAYRLEQGEAQVLLEIACDKGFVPAYCLLGEIYQDIESDQYPRLNLEKEYQLLFLKAHLRGDIAGTFKYGLTLMRDSPKTGITFIEHATSCGYESYIYTFAMYLIRLSEIHPSNPEMRQKGFDLLKKITLSDFTLEPDLNKHVEHIMRETLNFTY